MQRRRARTRGEGSIYKKVRRWHSGGKTHAKEIWVATCRVGGRGRRRRHFFYGATAAQARAKRDAFLLAHGAKVPEPAADLTPTIAEYAEEFLAHTKAQRRANTVRAYDKTLRLHVLPRIGDVRLGELPAPSVRAFYSALRSKVSPSMVHRVHVTLRALLNLARDQGVILASPLDAMRREAPRYKRPSIEALTEPQIRTLLKAAKGHRLEALFVLALSTGMRQGELFALRWSDVDLARKSVYIQRSAQEVNDEITFVEPKTASGRRRITLSRIAIEALKHRRGIAKGEEHASELVFPSERGYPLRKSNFTRKIWDPIRKAAGVPSARFHDLRHSAATLMLAEGIHPRIVQEMLGHASITLTLQTYSHALPTMQAGAAAAFDRVLASSRKPLRSEEVA